MVQIRLIVYATAVGIVGLGDGGDPYAAHNVEKSVEAVTMAVSSSLFVTFLHGYSVYVNKLHKTECV